jgi:hypothetical protein
MGCDNLQVEWSPGMPSSLAQGGAWAMTAKTWVHFDTFECLTYFQFKYRIKFISIRVLNNRTGEIKIKQLYPGDEIWRSFASEETAAETNVTFQPDDFGLVEGDVYVAELAVAAEFQHVTGYATRTVIDSFKNLEIAAINEPPGPAVDPDWTDEDTMELIEKYGPAISGLVGGYMLHRDIFSGIIAAGLAWLIVPMINGMVTDAIPKTGDEEQDMWIPSIVKIVLGLVIGGIVGAIGGKTVVSAGVGAAKTVGKTAVSMIPLML